MYNKMNEQMELRFDLKKIESRAETPSQKIPLAGWWFDQIRQIIDAREVAPVMRPVQVRFQFSPHRKVCNSV